MSPFITVLLMSLFLGVGSFGVGMLPLTFTYPKSYITKLSTLGTGLLLGTALGVIIPEGIETVASSHPSSELPTSKIALSLLCGFVFMLIVEQFMSPHSHSHPSIDSVPPLSHATEPEPNPPRVHFDVELGELEEEQGPGYTQADLPPAFREGGGDSQQKAYPLTVGLIIHGIADGLALGASALSSPDSGALPDLSLVVFIALIIHKAPTVLALATSLLATSLPRSECKKHIAFFSLSTPLGAIVSYGVVSFLGAGGEGEWTGLALLVSGGTFLYVATVLQPVSHHDGSQSSADGMSETMRAIYIVAGMFVPFAIGQLLGGHDHAGGISEIASGE